MYEVIVGLSFNHKPNHQDHMRDSGNASPEKLNKSAITETKKRNVYENSLSPFARGADTTPPKRKNWRFYDTHSTLNLLDDGQDEDKSFYMSKASIEDTPQKNRSKSRENYKSSNMDYLFSDLVGDEFNIRNSATFDNRFNNKDTNRSTGKIHQKNDSMTKLQSFRKDHLNSGSSSINIYNPITNPIPFTIKNPYIIREIQQGNFRSKSPYVAVIGDSICNLSAL